MNLRDIIQEFPSVKRSLDLLHDGEDCMNPAYQDIEDVTCSLRENEKRIWVLRTDTDMVLATGVKNSEFKQGNTPMNEVVCGAEKLNEKNIYGHPSLAVPDITTNYDGSVYYAGWITQRAKNLVVYVYTGRCQNKDLSMLQKQCLELYIGIQFLNAYGDQDIVFYDRIVERKGLFDFFLSNKPFDQEHEKTARYYSSSLLKKVASLDELDLLSKDTIKKLLGEERLEKSLSALDKSEQKTPQSDKTSQEPVATAKKVVADVSDNSLSVSSSLKI